MLVTKRFEFDCAHRLTTHLGKCRNLHGHRYVAEVTCEGVSNSQDMVVDFGVIRDTVGGWIDQHWDHCTILNRDDRAILQVCKEQNWNTFVVDCDPTVESMCLILHGVAKYLLGPEGIQVSKVRLYETPTSWAETS